MFGIAPYLRFDLIDPAAPASGNTVTIVVGVALVAAALLFFVLRGRK